MKSYYEEVKAWLEGPDDGRIPGEAFVGLVAEHERLLEQLSAVRSACLRIDTMVQKDPTKWQGSLNWATGQMMSVVKYGKGYPNCDSPKGDMTVKDNGMFPMSLHPSDPK